MKFFTVLLSATLILFSLAACQPTDEGPGKYETIEQGLNSGTVVDTIFLGYRFGMSEKEVKGHTKELIKSDKLFSKLRGNYYRFILDKYSTLEGRLQFEYFQGKLKELQICFDDEAIGEYTIELLLDKYKDKYINNKPIEERAKYFETDGYRDYKDYDFIKGNLDIVFFYNSKGLDLKIFYKDGRIQQEEDKYKEKVAEEQINDL